MSVPSIHNCLYLSAENERIKRKYKKLVKRNGQLEKELSDLKEQFNRNNELMQTFTRSVQVQTDAKRPKSAGGVMTMRGQPNQSQPQRSEYDRPRKSMDEQFERTTKMLSLHNDLMKKYQKEQRTNTAQVEKIATLSLENRDLEKKLHDAQRKMDEVQRENEALQTRINAMGVKERITPSKRDLMANLQKVSQERDQLAKERRKFKDELKMLDKGFFEEIEDLKYALQQAARLNSAYEKALRQLCSQCGMPYPKINPTTPKKHKRKRTRSQAREFNRS
ncbi:centrosomal protein of 290 kDa-like [Montipora foliosa]|uniref:centrosomal protein of 290 kDa-like n=1 Tax=Montipora foliosa TaxID=591990 RepID=UPI0035F13273